MASTNETFPAEERARIVSQLPDDWSEQEIERFLASFGNRVAEEITTADPEYIPPDDNATDELPLQTTNPTPRMVETMGISTASRKGLTLDSYVIINGRSVPLRAIHEAGQLEPLRSVRLEGSRRNPRRVVHYEARVVDQPRWFVITEETYRVLSPEYAQEYPHDEVLSLEAMDRVQASPTYEPADELDRRRPR